MSIEWWIAFVKEGGPYCAVLELAAILWLLSDRARILADLKERTGEVKALAERVIEIATDLRTFLFNERKT